MQQPFFELDPAVRQAGQDALERARPDFQRIDEITEYNQLKVLSAFIRHGVSESHFVSSTGYGYDDRGRDTLDRVFADVMGAEDALVRLRLRDAHAGGGALWRAAPGRYDA